MDSANSSRVQGVSQVQLFDAVGNSSGEVILTLHIGTGGDQNKCGLHCRSSTWASTQLHHQSGIPVDGVFRSLNKPKQGGAADLSGANSLSMQPHAPSPVTGGTAVINVGSSNSAEAKSAEKGPARKTRWDVRPTMNQPLQIQQAPPPKKNNMETEKGKSSKNPQSKSDSEERERRRSHERKTSSTRKPRDRNVRDRDHRSPDRDRRRRSRSRDTNKRRWQDRSSNYDRRSRSREAIKGRYQHGNAYDRRSRSRSSSKGRYLDKHPRDWNNRRRRTPEGPSQDRNIFYGNYQNNDHPARNYPPQARGAQVFKDRFKRSPVDLGFPVKKRPQMAGGVHVMQKSEVVSKVSREQRLEKPKRKGTRATANTGWQCPICRRLYVNRSYIPQHMKKSICKDTLDWLKTNPLQGWLLGPGSGSLERQKLVAAVRFVGPHSRVEGK